MIVIYIMLLRLNLVKEKEKKGKEVIEKTSFCNRSDYSEKKKNTYRFV